MRLGIRVELHLIDSLVIQLSYNRTRDDQCTSLNIGKLQKSLVITRIFSTNYASTSVYSLSVISRRTIIRIWRAIFFLGRWVEREPTFVNKCDHFGWQLKKIAKSTKSSITISISRFCPKSGLNALECFGKTQNQQNNSQCAIALLVNPCDGSVISRKALPFTMGRELSNSLVLTKRQITTTGSAPTL